MSVPQPAEQLDPRSASAPGQISRAEVAHLAPFARSSVRSGRRGVLGLGLILMGLGLLVLGILAAVTLSGAAGPDDGILPISIMTFVVAVLPAAWLLRLGLKNDDRHPLVFALEQRPANVRAIGYGYREELGGSYTKVATVTLTDGSAHGFDVPPDEAQGVVTRRSQRGPRPTALGAGVTSFSGELVPSASAWSGLAGEGSVEVGPGGLVLVATRARERIALVGGVVLGAAAGLLTILAVIELPAIDDPRLPAVLAIAIAYGSYLGARTLLARALPRTEVRHAIGWDRVTSVRLSGRLVELATTAPELTGLSCLRTDRPEALVEACANARRV